MLANVPMTGPRPCSNRTLRRIWDLRLGGFEHCITVKNARTSPLAKYSYSIRKPSMDARPHPIMVVVWRLYSDDEFSANSKSECEELLERIDRSAQESSVCPDRGTCQRNEPH